MALNVVSIYLLLVVKIDAYTASGPVLLLASARLYRVVSDDAAFVASSEAYLIADGQGSHCRWSTAYVVIVEEVAYSRRV